ncbi:MAG: DUF2914 domain-containing protein, partial [Methylomonas sp.]
TVWHTRRILAAVLILILLVVIPIFWFSNGDDRNSDQVAKTEYVEKEQTLADTDSVTQETDAPIKGSNPVVAVSPQKKEGLGRNELVKDGVKRPPAIIYNKRVVRASLNSGAKDKEPYQSVKPPVRLSKGETLEVFYFNELKDIKNKLLYHVWSKNGQVIDKRLLNIRNNREKVLSSRTLGYKDKGEWQIQLVDQSGKVFSEVNFLVDQE